MYYTVLALNCTFESGWCGYTQDQKDDFDWSRTNISSPTIGTGPDRDHTTGHGDLINPTCFRIHNKESSMFMKYFSLTIKKKLRQ